MKQKYKKDIKRVGRRCKGPNAQVQQHENMAEKCRWGEFTIFRFAHDRWNRGERGQRNILKYDRICYGFYDVRINFLIFTLVTFAYFTGHEKPIVNFLTSVTNVNVISPLYTDGVNCFRCKFKFKFSRIRCKNLNFCYNRNTGNSLVEYKRNTFKTDFYRFF